MAKAVVLLSGGLDSTTCLALAVKEGHEIHALSFRYGQKHSVELERASVIAEKYKVKLHNIIDIDTGLFSGSSLTDPDIDVKKDGGLSTSIPQTYVPARNTVLLSHALAYGESIRAEHIYIGVNSVDYSGYPDCRPEYIKAFQKMADLAVKRSVEDGLRIEIKAPLINMNKSEIIRLGKKLNVDYSVTVSCYDPAEGKACGKCESCILRKKGFEEAGIKDETIYI